METLAVGDMVVILGATHTGEEAEVVQRQEAGVIKVRLGNGEELFYPDSSLDRKMNVQT